MTPFLDRLNLRPNERRLVVIVALVVFVVLYFVFVWPQFAEWDRLQKRRAGFQQTLQRFQTEINKTAAYQLERLKLQEKGRPVSDEGQALDMQRIVNSQAAVNGVTINSYTGGRGAIGSGGKTNAYFEEQTGNIQFIASETNLVDFLFALSDGNSLIRASSMTLNPDPSRIKLMGTMTLVASYPKKAPPKAAPTAPAVPGMKSPSIPGVKPPAGTPPKTMSAAVAAAARPAGTNAPPAPSAWGRVKGWFGSSSTPPAKAPPATNAPPRKP